MSEEKITIGIYRSDHEHLKKFSPTGESAADWERTAFNKAEGVMIWTIKRIYRRRIAPVKAKRY